jgi:hypothetical protein
MRKVKSLNDGTDNSQVKNLSLKLITFQIFMYLIQKDLRGLLMDKQVIYIYIYNIIFANPCLKEPKAK